jgi:hypothetical protein
MTSEERAIVDTVARCLGRELAAEEIYLSLIQARQVGDLPYDPVEGCGYRAD